LFRGFAGRETIGPARETILVQGETIFLFARNRRETPGC
jgi:hypothetical protein